MLLHPAIMVFLNFLGVRDVYWAVRVVCDIQFVRQDTLTALGSLFNLFIPRCSYSSSEIDLFVFDLWWQRVKRPCHDFIGIICNVHLIKEKLNVTRGEGG